MGPYHTMKPDIIASLSRAGLSENTSSRLANSITTRFLLQPSVAVVPPGASKIGGHPHWPAGLPYPQEKDFIYEFVAQVNLADLADGNDDLLPHAGMLYFFIDDDFNVGNINAHVVLHTDVPALEVTPPPKGKPSRCESFDGRKESTQMKLNIAKGYTFEQKALDDAYNELDAAGRLATAGFDPEQFNTRDQIWGYPVSWVNIDRQWSAYLAKKGMFGLYWFTSDRQLAYLQSEQIDLKQWLYGKLAAKIEEQKGILEKNDKTIYIYPYWEQELRDLEYAQLHLDDFIDNLAFHKEACKKWRLLLSMSSYNEANICFGDGRMEFYIHTDDLQQLNFSNIYCNIV